MTGLFENVRNLQNEKNLTFLYRAVKINVGSLSLIDIAESYKKIFGVNQETANKLARFTNGYAFAYQLLGYLLFENNKKDLDEQVIDEFDRYLREYVYEKIYYDLPDTEKQLVIIIAETSTNISEIMSEMSMNKQNISQYRDKLIKKGLIVKTDWGKVDFSLPRFREYVLIQKDLG